MASPSLVIRRLVVNGDLSCDMRFERGLNVIASSVTDRRFSNKSGKTAFVELVQHGLGKRQGAKRDFHFAPIMDDVRSVLLEIEANGTVLTIERSLQEITSRLRIREGAIGPNILQSPYELVSVEDMSPLMLRSLGIPVVSVKTAQGDLEPLSFPLLSRAFILHQEDSFGQILDKVQPERRKADIIGFLSRITPIERFEAEDHLAKVQTEAQALEEYYRSVQAFLSENGIPSLMEAEARVRTAEEELRVAVASQLSVQQEIKQSDTRQAEWQPGHLDDLRQRLLMLKERAAGIDYSLVGLRQEEDRLRELLASLETDRRKTLRLRASTIILSSVDFNICPRCLLEITPEMRQREQFARCSLCNRPIRTTSDTPPRSTPKSEDLDLQIEETQTVLKDVQRERDGASRALQQLRVEEVELGRRLDTESRLYIAPVVDRLLARTHEVAQKEAQLAQAQALLGQAQALAEVSTRLSELKQRQAELEDELRETRRPYRSRLEALRGLYEQILREVDLPGFQSCTIDSETMMPQINGFPYIHLGAALKGLATIAYHLALMELARQEDTFFPRMLIVDSPAVGDLNEENHDKLLRFFAELQSRAEHDDDAGKPDWPDWQIILTTRRLTEGLEPYVSYLISNATNQMLLRRQVAGKM